ncbi:Eco57I restriction-modification methylase domain-containing protein [Halorussus sp. MSC15.2]|uniref:Eco57I restriction-modification methylase domain-containing protein n=1 Tax=Halorussus sp. MSC15.2 TaxID=2283638 RepID=UPI0013D3EFA3|nr:N-6 DNA methylase [Halorussus sp. MSC15.2]NEU56271.1 N-6 DNA methylase [Halorussus sp. MSC15.2]
MKGHVPTPDEVADHIVAKLFDGQKPEQGDRILYPGLGTGPFVAAVERYCEANDYPIPDGVGIDSDPELIAQARDNHTDRNVEVVERDFLDDVSDLGEFQFIVSNPPYVPIEGLDEDEKQRYKETFDTAVGRFDLYILFFEQSLDLLDDNGRLSFITPEKFEYVDTGAPLRRILTNHHIEEIEHVAEDTFSGLVTYPTITTLSNSEAEETRVVHRDGSTETVTLPGDGESWASTVRAGEIELDETGVTLGDVTVRVSCGLATGADSLFVMEEDEVPPQLEEWAWKTTSGRQLSTNDGPESGTRVICPYRKNGNLIPEDELGDLGDWLELNEERLRDRSCVEKGKVWYSWHENPPMQDVLQPKIVCPDIIEEPKFWLETEGDVIPRHSVYYIIPEDSVDLHELHDYLNTPEVQEWIEQHAQKAHNDYYRMQSRVLKKLPVPKDWGETVQQTLV